MVCHPTNDMRPPVNIVKKICILGDLYVGKSSLIKRYVINQYSDVYKPTIGSQVLKKTMLMDFEPKRPQKVNLTILIFDLIGHLEFKKLLKTYFLGAEGALVIGDFTREETITSMLEWHRRFKEVVGYRPVLFLGNKVDLFVDKDPNINLLEQVTAEADTSYLLTSAKTGENVEKAFDMLAKAMLDKDAIGSCSFDFNYTRGLNSEKP
jgi:small GTP-binding protein